jgi:glycosyltransferase involved in cell wall biosynthesis
MHICFVNMPIEFYSPVSGGAIATVIMQCSRELLARGHQVSVLTRVNDDERYDFGEVTPIEGRDRDDLHFLQRRWSSFRSKLSRWDWPYFGYYLRSFTQALARFVVPPDAVVLFNDLVSSKYVKRVLPEAKVAVWLHNEWRTRHDIAETVQHTDAFVTCSDYIRRWTSENHRIPLDSITTAHNGVDLSVFSPRPGYLEPAQPLRVLFLARIDPNKGPDIIADAVAELREQGIPIELTVAGGLWFYGHGREMENPYFRELKAKMDRAGARYLGHVKRADVPELCRQHDVVAVLSRSQEPFSLVALEGMASGCVALASTRGGLPEACGGAGIPVDPDDFPSIVAALRRLATDPEYLKTEKQKCVARAARSPWSACARKLEEALS